MNTKQWINALGLCLMASTMVACGGSGGGQGPIADVPPVSPAPPNDPTAPVVGAVIEMTDLIAGTCAEPIGPGAEVEYLKVVDCNAPHSFEVAGTVERPEASDAEFPGDRELSFSAHQDCRATFEAWVGRAYTGDELTIETIVPSRGTWRDGDREIICLVTGENGAMLDSPAGG